MTRIIDSLAEISAPYDALFCDLWGCVHDGERPFPAAIEALQAFRQAGKTVVLVTNSPQHRKNVEAQLGRMGLPEDTWDTIATSGDAARLALFTGAVGDKVYFIGEDRDLSFFEPLHLLENPIEVERVPLAEAKGVVCTGPFDPLAPPEDLRPELLMAKTKGLPFLCANPDIVVDRGEVREWCAGAVAALYTEMGGESLYFGKPHPPIYDLARRRLTEIGKLPSDSRILAIGDGIATDVKGALGEDIDSLFITGGLARDETKTTDQPDPDALSAFTNKEMTAPTFAMGYLK